MFGRRMRGSTIGALWALCAISACTQLPGALDASVEVDPESLAPTLLTTQLESGAIGALYGHRFQARGGRQPYAWVVLSPSWLTMDLASGEMRGVPPSNAGGTATVSVRVTDSLGKATTVDLSLVLRECPAGV